VIDEAFPAGACDTHVHFYDQGFPVASTSLLRPPNASVADYRLVQQALGLQRVVVVQPTTYGRDNSCQLQAVADLGDGARLVAVVDNQVTDRELSGLTERGGRGARFFMLPGGAVPWDMLSAVARRIAPFDWHIQLQMLGNQLVERVDALLALPVAIVIDHVGRFEVPVDSRAFQSLLRLIDGGACWVKLSAPYESELDPTHRYGHVTSLVHALVKYAPERMLWATNWPHPGQLDPPGFSDLHQLMLHWLPSASTRQRVLVDNPAELYGFSNGPT
jgi:D-galactarolactone isomerase